jgi:hypothetical protein
MLTVRAVFPKAMLVNDRFHVQQLVTDAIDQMRIGFRWQVLAQENRVIREHRSRRKAVHTGAEKDLIGEWEPERMKNGETRPQIMARSRHIVLMHKSKRNAQQQARVASSSGCSQGRSRHTTSISIWWTSSTRTPSRQRPGSIWPDGITR